MQRLTRNRPIQRWGGGIALRHSFLELSVIGLFLVLMASTACSAVPEKGGFRCLVCGQFPITGVIWTNTMGAFCAECAHLETHCSICGIPVRDGFAKTADGRLICKTDLPNVVLDQEEARRLFAITRSELVGYFGKGFALKQPLVTVNMFDVDYWSEKNNAAPTGLQKYGFSNSRPGAGGEWTHTVVLLSGRPRTDIIAACAHEYTHLWITENRAPNRDIDGDTLEAICEWAAWKYCGVKSWPQQQDRIAANSYTRGKIREMIALDKEPGNNFFEWVKTGTTKSLDSKAQSHAGSAQAALDLPPPRSVPSLPEGLLLSGTMTISKQPLATINGESFRVGQTRALPLRAKTVLVTCREIRNGRVVVDIDANHHGITLYMGNMERIEFP